MGIGRRRRDRRQRRWWPRAAEVTQKCMQLRTDEPDKESGQSELDSSEIKRSVVDKTGGRPV